MCNSVCEICHMFTCQALLSQVPNTRPASGVLSLTWLASIPATKIDVKVYVRCIPCLSCPKVYSTPRPRQCRPPLCQCFAGLSGLLQELLRKVACQIYADIAATETPEVEECSKVEKHKTQKRFCLRLRKMS